MSSRSPDLLDMLRGLIASPSVSSVSPDLDMGNRALIDLLATWLDDLGFAVTIQPVPEHPDKANLIATLGSGEDGLVLAGHTDTVPYDEGRWQHDPFRLTEADGRLYGLGTCDMKAFLGLAIAAACEFDPRELRRPLTIVATADEESSMNGAKTLAAAGRRPGRFAVIGEPTGLKPVRTHKGILMEAIRVLGRSGHSSDPRLGASALEGMHKVISHLIAYRTDLQRRYKNPAFGVPVPTLNLGRIWGGDNPNRICPECELHIDIRPLPGMGVDEVRAGMRERVERALAGSELRASFEALFDGLEAMETPPESLVVRAAEEATGTSAGAVAFGTEGPFFNALGMQTVILGPGDIEQAHQPDEYLRLDRIEPTLQVLRTLIRRLCIEAA